jgi:hypothetical protein
MGLSPRQVGTSLQSNKKEIKLPNIYVYLRRESENFIPQFLFHNKILLTQQILIS